MKLIPKFVIFTVILVLISVLSTATESRNDDELCHRGCDNEKHKDTYYQHVIIKSFEAPDSMKIDKQADVSVIIENECNTEKESYNTFDYVDLTLTSVNGYITINDATKKITNMKKGSENSKTVTWTIEGKDIGDDTLSLDVHAHNPHEDCDKYDKDSVDIKVESASPDIEILSHTLKPIEPVEGEILFINAGVLNKGSDATWNITFYVDDEIIDSLEVELVEDASENLESTWETSGNPGNHVIKVEASGVPSEDYVDNNILEVDIIVLKRADLTITQLTFDPIVPVKGQIVNIFAKIENLGEATTNLSAVCFLNDENYIIGIVNLTLDGRELKDISFNLLPSNHGNHTIKVIADPKNLVNESNEDNNFIYKNITVSKPPDIPDPSIHPSEIKYPENILEGNNINITVVVRNLGNASVSYTIRLSLLGAQITVLGEESIDMDALGVRNVSFFWNTSNEFGNLKIKAELLDITPEEVTSENNKALLDFFISKRPELSIVNLTWYPNFPMAGKNLTINATIENSGGFDASCTVHFYINNNHSKVLIFVLANTTVVASTILIIMNKSLLQVKIDNIIPWEWNISNNQADELVEIFTYQDLHIKTMNISNLEPIQGESIQIIVNVINMGNLKGTGNIVIFSDGKIFNNSTLSISPGEDENLQFTWIAEVGTHTFKIILYLPSNDPEGDEEREIKIIVSPTSPNVSLQTIAFSPSNPKIGGEMQIYILVQNQGGTKANVTITLNLDNNLFSANVIEVKEMGKETVSFIWIAEKGNHIFEAKITATEPDGIINESTLKREVQILEVEDNEEENKMSSFIFQLIIGVILLVIIAFFLLKRRRKS